MSESVLSTSTSTSSFLCHERKKGRKKSFLPRSQRALLIDENIWFLFFTRDMYHVLELYFHSSILRVGLKQHKQKQKQREEKKRPIGSAGWRKMSHQSNELCKRHHFLHFHNFSGFSSLFKLPLSMEGRERRKIVILLINSTHQLSQAKCFFSRRTAWCRFTFGFSCISSFCCRLPPCLAHPFDALEVKVGETKKEASVQRDSKIEVARLSRPPSDFSPKKFLFIPE